MIWTGELSFWQASRNPAANTAATQSAIKATSRALGSGTKNFFISRGRRVRHRPQVVLAEAVRL